MQTPSPPSDGQYPDNLRPYAPHHPVDWEHSNQAPSRLPSSHEPTGRGETDTSAVTSYVSPGPYHEPHHARPPHHPSSQVANNQEVVGYHPHHRLTMPSENRPPVQINTGMIRTSHQHSVTQLHVPGDNIANHMSGRHQQNYSPPTSRRHSNVGIFAPVQYASPPSVHTHTSASREPLSEYPEPLRPTPYARSASAGYQRDAAQGSLHPPLWGSAAGSDSETGPASSISPSPVEGHHPHGPIWSPNQQFDHDGMSNPNTAREDSSPSADSYSASDSGSSPTHASSILHGADPYHRPPTSRSQSKRPAGAAGSRKNKMHACPICKKQFPRPSGLATHMNSHTGARRMSPRDIYYIDRP
ncbi:hypothetical protein HWV62_37693 [Athelia sp. TMB]|nr:hypothetical protein HWV62_42211 [Athelia sp. TMB]KAF7975379.1 hypothetical protein HWV62_9717 [Athelia sp. TMB]KAF7980547.1 hypothetical protein HWV62_37693 [Athelia sp. TMB]